MKERNYSRNYILNFKIQSLFLADSLATLNTLRESVTDNEENIETLQQTVALLGNSAGDALTSNVVQRLTQLEEANTSKMFLSSIVIKVNITK